MMRPKPKILFIDAYDSFTNNIISLLSTTLDCTVRVIHIDTDELPTEDELRAELRNYDAIVCGPGPGDPSVDEDVGIMKRFWQLAEVDLIPVLGICLGFQSLALEYGAVVRRLNEGLHGMIRRIHHVGENAAEAHRAQCDIFEGVREVQATLYHSLCVDIGQDTLTTSEFSARKWESNPRSPLLQPLAWVVQQDAPDERILMAIRHTQKPFWGIQYHPESICTNAESNNIISNWFEAAHVWNTKYGRQIVRDRVATIGRNPQPSSLLDNTHWSECKTSTNVEKTSAQDMQDTYTPDESDYFHKYLAPQSLNCRLEHMILDVPRDLSVAGLAEFMVDDDPEQIILESSNAHLQAPPVGTADVRGRYSIIALGVSKALKIRYRTGDDFYLTSGPVEDIHDQHMDCEVRLAQHTTIWQVLAQFAERRRLEEGPPTPFWGGFMGYTTYEMGLNGIGVTPAARIPSIKAEAEYRPDLDFAWITSSLIIDHHENILYIQNLSKISAPLNWLALTRDKITTYLARTTNQPTTPPSQFGGNVAVPIWDDYETKVSECQEYIRRGDSYELCLTDQTRITRDIEPSRQSSQPTNRGLADLVSWQLYTRLRVDQPAPMASYIRLGNCTYISASPERFLAWSASGQCSLRPMKGTVKKTPAVQTLAQAQSLLQVPKEQAENLMIVDLVRHDLYGICGPGGVQVPRLMVVEEYASVFQMISVVQGQIPTGPVDEESDRSRYTGIDVLAATLPPGSMTGAPKKRSCEILQKIEGGRERSLYSGVVGYIDAGGRGDFSVNIRCLFRWDKEGGPDEEIWHVGAGGAVTGLSTPKGEREEMMTKLSGTLGMFHGLSN